MKNDKTPEEIIKFWREVQGALNHPERKKFSEKVDVDAFAERMINSALKDKENELEGNKV